MSHPRLDELEHILRLLAALDELKLENKADIEKYLRWAARKAAKAYWYSVELTVAGD